MADLTGQTFGGCELLNLLGRGGMGEVYRGLQKSLDRHVAVKLLPSQLIDDPSYVERFLLEAKSIARLSHTNVVQVFDAGQESEYYYIVMELVEGGTLKDLINDRHVPPLLEIIDFMEQAAMGLSAAHQQGIIHRDVKPGNIMLASERVVKVTDFGLAKAVREQGKEITRTGEVVGTPAYMSPEQCEGSAVDHRSDIYSYGATFYHFAAGKTPFSADGPVQIMFKHIREVPEKLTLVRADIPIPLSNILDRCLAKDPFDRYQTCEEIVLDLHRAADGRPVESYKAGEGRKNFMAGTDDATSVYDVPQKSAAHGTTVYRKRELAAKEQEQRGDVEAKRGRWAFALMAYKEALKVFPDSAELKAKMEDAQSRVEQEGLEDSLSRSRRCAAEGRFGEAYDVLGAAIRGAGNDEQREKARSVLKSIELAEGVWSHKRRLRFLFRGIFGLAAAVVIIMAVQKYAGKGIFEFFVGDSSAGTTTATSQPPPSDQGDSQSIPTRIILVEDEWDNTGMGSDDTTEDSGKQDETGGSAADNPLVKMLLDAAAGGGDGKTTPSTPATEGPAENVSLERLGRRRVTLGKALSVAVPDFLVEKTAGEQRVVCEGEDPWGGAWALTLEGVGDDLDAGEALDEFLERSGVKRTTAVERGWRFARSFGRIPEAQFSVGENGRTTRVVVFPLSEGQVLVAISYAGKSENLLGEAYGDLLNSARVGR